MKKIVSIFVITIFSLFIFAGCGIEGSETIAGIEFIRDVFYVDYNVETNLEYKVYPSTADNFYVTFDIAADLDLSGLFVCHEGKIIIDDEKFPVYDPDSTSPNSISVKVRASGVEDTCEVRLREYPEAIGFDKEEDVLNCGTVYDLQLKGIFKKGVRYCNIGEFNYKITSSDPSVIKVVSEDNLKVQSTGRRGFSTITVEICNAKGQKLGLTATIGLKVVDTIENVYASFGDRFVMVDGETKNPLKANNGEEFKVQVRYFNEDGFVIKLADYDCFLSNNKVMELVTKSDGKYLKIIGAGEVEIMLNSTGVNADGNPVQIRFKVVVQIL